MSNIVSMDKNKMPAHLVDVFNLDDEDDLSGGVSGGFSVVSIRGSKWRVKHNGEETPLLNAEGDPVASLEVVILKSSPMLSHIYYEKSYEEGDDQGPDCYSLNGERPEADSRNKQADNCATCPNAVWGSKITPAGKKAKKCQDNRRVAVVPAGDVVNEIYGGPMLLRIPAASLGDLAAFGKGLKAKGFPYNTISARIGFDMDVSYPKLTFKAVRPLTDQQLQEVADHLTSGRVATILEQANDYAVAPEAAAAPEPKPEPKVKSSVDVEFEMEEPAATEPAKEKPATKKAAAKEEPKAEAKSTQLDDDLDDILSDLEGLN
jgi:hypothetical protein